MKGVFRLLWFFLLCESGFTQQPFNKVFTVNGSYNIPSTIIHTDTGYICTGTPGITNYMLDLSGDVKWVKQFNIGPAYSKNLIQTPDSNYRTTIIVQYGGIIDHIVYAGYNNKFDTLFTKILYTDSSANAAVFGNFIFKDENDDYLIAGTTYFDSSGIYFNPEQSQGLLIKTDTCLDQVQNYRFCSRRFI